MLLHSLPVTLDTYNYCSLEFHDIKNIKIQHTLTTEKFIHLTKVRLYNKIHEAFNLLAKSKLPAFHVWQLEL